MTSIVYSQRAELFEKDLGKSSYPVPCIVLVNFLNEWKCEEEEKMACQ